MAKKKVTYDVFVRVIVPDGTDPSKIESVLHDAASRNSWDFSSTIQEENEPWYQEADLFEED